MPGSVSDDANRLAAAEGLLRQVGREPERVVLGDDGVRQPLRAAGAAVPECEQRPNLRTFVMRGTLPELMATSWYGHELTGPSLGTG